MCLTAYNSEIFFSYAKAEEWRAENMFLSITRHAHEFVSNATKETKIKTTCSWTRIHRFGEIEKYVHTKCWNQIWESIMKRKTKHTHRKRHDANRKTQQHTQTHSHTESVLHIVIINCLKLNEIYAHFYLFECLFHQSFSVSFTPN